MEFVQFDRKLSDYEHRAVQCYMLDKYGMPVPEGLRPPWWWRPLYWLGLVK